ncbi:nitroreductase family protein [Flavihumibacter petaseus]|uniref:Putative oxidoreductase n=1 Tax=Flavihumibacter petaseus NBRC 106054 TaxID=1220578 RepID=A0A0E9MWK7_9BACT|nr:nitroreductase family protein [Flavihumibacter petaseus]GAO41826.1 putative oxidoreductase [Flavihumibacter petaseus NBRC 106054]
MKYLQDLDWRYAAKRMNGQAVPVAKLENIKEAIRLAPSSLGLQPYSIIVVEDAALREALSPAIFHQPQVKEGSALIIFAAWKDITEEQVDAYLANIAATRNIPVEGLGDFRKMILGAVSGKTPEQIFQWNARQAYIALGYATAAAAFEQVDSTPMEGFSPEAVNRILSLEEKGLSAVAVLALGFRDAEKDNMARAPKVRRPSKALFTHYENELATA